MTLRKTSMTMDNASTKVEMFAREFAETGLRDMVWGYYRLTNATRRHRRFRVI